MKKYYILLLLVFVVGSVSIYTYINKSEKSVVTQGHALLPELKKEELIQQSDAIVVGQVESLNSTKILSEIRKGEQDIVTNTTIKVEKYLRNYTGNSSQEIIIQTLGGTSGSSTMNVEGSANFIKGEKVIVFLKKKSNNIFSIYGWAQGKYSIDNQGKLGVGEQEISYFQNVFGLDNSLTEVENQITLFKNIAPKSDSSSLNYSSDNQNMNADAKNSEANSVIKK